VVATLSLSHSVRRMGSVRYVLRTVQADVPTWGTCSTDLQQRAVWLGADRTPMVTLIKDQAMKAFAFNLLATLHSVVADFRYMGENIARIWELGR